VKLVSRIAGETAVNFKQHTQTQPENYYRHRIIAAETCKRKHLVPIEPNQGSVKFIHYEKETNLEIFTGNIF
jgi:hypothetical protein